MRKAEAGGAQVGPHIASHESGRRQRRSAHQDMTSTGRPSAIQDQVSPRSSDTSADTRPLALSSPRAAGHPHNFNLG